VRSLTADHRLVLTGTPIENRLLDLWSLMAFATPGILGQRGYFERQFEKRDDPLARQRIAARLRPFLLRRTKREVAPDLPPRVEEDHLCELEGVQADLYRAELKRARSMLLGIENQRQFNEQRFKRVSARGREEVDLSISSRRFRSRATVDSNSALLSSPFLPRGNCDGRRRASLASSR